MHTAVSRNEFIKGKTCSRDWITETFDATKRTLDWVKQTNPQRFFPSLYHTKSLRHWITDENKRLIDCREIRARKESRKNQSSIEWKWKIAF